MDSSEIALNPEILDWNSSENSILLNPRWPADSMVSLVEVAKTITAERRLQGHLWLATSGSTAESVGHIKLVALSKKAFLSSARSVNSHLHAKPTDTWLQILPRFHVGGLGVEVRAGLTSSRVTRDLEKWDPQRIHQLIKEQEVTIASMVPTQVFDLVQAGWQAPQSLRAVIVGGGALNEGLYYSARKLGWPLLPSYGMTETCSQIATASLPTLQAEAMPRPELLSHASWRQTPEGLLQVRGESLLTCYGQRQKDGRIHGWDPKVDGWFTSEDYVQLEGNKIRVLGRKNDFIKIGGEGTSLGRLREIFDRVLAQGDISLGQQILLVDAPSDRLGSEIHLITTLGERADFMARLKESFNREVLPFERIREVKYISTIPRSDLGKVLWAQLKRDLYGH